MSYLLLLLLVALALWIVKRSANRSLAVVDEITKVDLIDAEKALARLYLAKSPHPESVRQAEHRYIAAAQKHCPNADHIHVLNRLYTDYDGYRLKGHTKDWGDGTATMFVSEKDAEAKAKD